MLLTPIGRPVVVALGESDCEAIGAGLIAQPLATLSSGAYLLAAAWVVARPSSDRVTALHLALVGAGSILFHGPQPPGTRWLHDLAVIGLLGWMVGRALVRSGVLAARPAVGRLSAVGAVVAGVVALIPDAGLVVIGGLAVALVGIEVRARRVLSTPPIVFILAAIALSLQVLGRTGGPLCEPDSVFQLHAAWHVLTATAVALWASGDALGSDPTTSPDHA